MGHCSIKWCAWTQSLKGLAETGKGQPAPHDATMDRWNCTIHAAMANPRWRWACPVTMPRPFGLVDWKGCRMPHLWRTRDSPVHHHPAP